MSINNIVLFIVCSAYVIGMISMIVGIWGAPREEDILKRNYDIK